MQRAVRVVVLLALVASLCAGVRGGGVAARDDLAEPGEGLDLQGLQLGGRAAAAPSRTNRPSPMRRVRRELSSSDLREALADVTRRPRHAVADDPDRARVEVFHDVDDAHARAIIERAGGVVTGHVPGVLVQAEVRWDDLTRLERTAGIAYVRPQKRIRIIPRESAPPSDEVTRKRRRRKKPRGGIGEEVTKTNANAWHAAGRLGAGTKVGIVDVFSSRAYNKAKKAGEVPTPAGTACFTFGRPCDVFTVTPRQTHGTAVAEVVHEMAPQAQLVLGFADTTADLQLVVDEFVRQGVHIVTRSLTSEYDGAGDGSGAIGAVVSNAISRGITWFNSAGNAAGSGPFPRSGAYYRGVFTDTDGDGLHEFSPNNEGLGIPCFVFTLGLRWDDFNEPGAAVTDFDLIEVDAQSRRLDASTDAQGSSGGSAPPIENFGGTACTNRRGSGLVYVVIKLVNPGSGASDVLEFANNGAPMTTSSNPFSAAVPVCDSADPGLVCVGAIDPPLGTQIAPYSSQGPTNDNRIKPDVSAAACLNTFSFARCFNGTSSSTPVAAAAAALVRASGLGGTTPQSLADSIRRAVVDRGAVGPDNVFGTGELLLPAPP